MGSDKNPHNLKGVERLRWEKESLGYEEDAYLRLKGWHHTSSTVGSNWLWKRIIKDRETGQETVYMLEKTIALAIQLVLDQGW